MSAGKNRDTPFGSAQSSQGARKPILFEFVLLDPFSILSVTSAIEPLRVANRMAGYECYDWTIVTEDGGPVRASNGLILASEGRIGEGPKPDYTFVCAGLSLVAQHQTRFTAFLNRRYSAGVTLGAISMGTIFLTRAGLLENTPIRSTGKATPPSAKNSPISRSATRSLKFTRTS